MLRVFIGSCGFYSRKKDELKNYRIQEQERASLMVQVNLQLGPICDDSAQEAGGFNWVQLPGIGFEFKEIKK